MSEIIADTPDGPKTVELETLATQQLVTLARGGVEDARRLLLIRTAQKMRRRR